MGPILDTVGVAQGGCPSDRIHRLTNNEQLETAQKSELGVDMGTSVTGSGLSRHVLSGVGQADDVGLLSSSLQSLKILLHLTKMYCSKYQVKLVGAKTKLLAFATKETAVRAKVEIAVTRITVDDQIISPSIQATYVVRSVTGNSANIMERLSAHRGAVFSVLHGGLARAHRANPAASLKVEKIYCVSVLLSGKAA